MGDRAVPGEQAAAGQEGAKAAAVPDVPDGVRGAGAGLALPSQMVEPLSMVIHHLLSEHLFSSHRPITPGSNRHFASTLFASSIEQIRRRVNYNTWCHYII
jgi:hypothetical protein